MPPCPPAAGLNADDALRVVDCADALRCGGGGECWWGSTEIGGRVLLLLLLPSPLIVAGVVLVSSPTDLSRGGRTVKPLRGVGRRSSVSHIIARATEAWLLPHSDLWDAGVDKRSGVRKIHLRGNFDFAYRVTRVHRMGARTSFFVVALAACSTTFPSSSGNGGNHVLVAGFAPLFPASSWRSHQQQQHQLSMVSTDDKVASSGLRKVTNAFDSPSIIKFNKEMKDGATNPFSSPAVRVNGGGTSNAIDPQNSPSVKMLSRKGTESVDAMKSPAVQFLGIDAEKVKNAMTSPSLQITSESKTKLDMPLSLVVGQEMIKTGLILLAVNPNIGGLVIAGGKGTAKSAMARALHRVMPPIEVVKGSEYNLAPDAMNNEVDDFLATRLRKEGKTLASLETEVVTCPFVQVPVNVMEDRLFGSVDVKKTLETGETVFTPGLMAAAHRGILYVDDINLLDDDLVTMMLQAVTDGFVTVEREGISVKYPCKPMLIATLNPEDSELKDVFLDRIGMALNADSEPLTMEDRVQAVSQVPLCLPSP